MTEEEKKEYDKYRFSGYEPPLIKIDETGPSVWLALPHPYYRNQPLYWTKGIGYMASGSVNSNTNQVLFVDRSSGGDVTDCSNCKMSHMLQIKTK